LDGEGVLQRRSSWLCDEFSVDGLGVSINHIVDRMRHDLSIHVPHAARSALFDVLAVTRAQVEARVRAGDAIVR
jgi:hypothetical protein